jgi:4-hydroxybenzoate polyprenyltransferase
MLVTVAALPFVVLYPAMKRITYWPQLFLGITFNWGILLAWASITGSLHPPAVALYCGAIFWTIAYDTIYAHQDKDDDLAAGIKSSALALGEHTKAFLVMAYILFIISIAASIYLSDLGWQSYLGLFPLAGIFAWQIKDLDIDDQQSCLTHFRLNRFIGLLVTFTLMLGWFHLPI